ncbi:hypothetical protein QBC36DRAFT_99972, partial [Triangularia setosa]
MATIMETLPSVVRMGIRLDGDQPCIQCQTMFLAQDSNRYRGAEDGDNYSANLPQKPQKYISRREAEAQRQAACLAEQKALEAERTAKAAAKRKREEDAAEEAKAREERRRKLAEESR